MDKRIIYRKNDGGVAIVVFSPEFLSSNTVESVIDKVVPNGAPYEIVDISAIPSDRTFREAWTWE